LGLIVWVIYIKANTAASLQDVLNGIIVQKGHISLPFALTTESIILAKSFRER
jgi:hypothetical protein